MMKQFKRSITTLTPLKSTSVLTYKDTARLAYRRQITRMFQNRVSRFICPPEINSRRHAWRIRTAVRRREETRLPRAFAEPRTTRLSHATFCVSFFRRERRRNWVAPAFRRTISNESRSRILKCPTKFIKLILHPFVQRQSQIYSLFLTIIFFEIIIIFFCTNWFWIQQQSHKVYTLA